MSPQQAAKVIGCDRTTVGRLIRSGKLKAKEMRNPNNPKICFYTITQADAEAAREDWLDGNRVGRPRGPSN